MSQTKRRPLVEILVVVALAVLKHFLKPLFGTRMGLTR